MPSTEKKEVAESDLYRHPENEYFPARLSKVEERSFEWHQKDFNTKELKYDGAGQPIMRSKTVWRWHFEITDGEFQGDNVNGETENEITTLEDNICRQWAEALLGAEINVGDGFDTDTVLGVGCMVRLAHDKPYRRADGTMGYFSSVVEVMPAVAAPPY